MRRQDIQLLAMARQGDSAARCEAGRRYLCGIDGFPQHIATGLDYLGHPSVKDHPQVARIIAESLPLQEILTLGHLKALETAAASGSVKAQVKLGAWLCARHGASENGRQWFEAAAAAGSEKARRCVVSLNQDEHAADALARLLRVASGSDELNGLAVATIAAREALADRDLCRLQRCLAAGLTLSPSGTSELLEMVVGAVRLAEQTGQKLHLIEPDCIEASLDVRASRGDRDAAYILGRALCSIDCGVLRSADIVSGANMRKGSALLLRAADAGCEAAWLHLYRIHADHRSSVANPGMARFFLEKAAVQGQREAQRRLGALILRSATSVAESEQAIHWLYQAGSQGDVHAARLLESLVLPVAGNDDDANMAVEQVGQRDPWLAARLRISRDFGLTKLEALCVDPAEALRSWGLVVGKNPFIAQTRLSAPRAVPALSPMALENLRRAAALFDRARREASMLEGDLRQRSLRQRRLFERHHLDESLFFAEASSMTLESLRQGPKWAFRTRQPLRMALAA